MGALASTDQRPQIVAATRGYALALSAAFALSFGCPDLDCSPRDAFGALTMSLLLMFYASPLPAMLDSIRQRNSQSIHAPLAAMTFCNAALWLTYGLSIHDWHMWVPQAVGVVLASTQLAMVAMWSD